jgi:Anti-sigma factor NepR
VQQTKKPVFSKRSDDAWRDWSSTKDRIGEQLKAHYQAIATEELPPRLLALLKKFDSDNPET